MAPEMLQQLEESLNLILKNASQEQLLKRDCQAPLHTE